VVTWTFFLAGLFVAVLCGSIWLFVEADDEAAQTAAAVVDAMVAIALGLLAVRGWLARRRRSPTLEERDKAARWLADEMRLRVHDEPTHRVTVSTGAGGHALESSTPCVLADRNFGLGQRSDRHR
jgi:hypothetical protein